MTMIGNVSFSATAKPTSYDVDGGTVTVEMSGHQTAGSTVCKFSASGSYTPKRGGFDIDLLRKPYKAYFDAGGDTHEVIGTETCTYEDGQTETYEYRTEVNDVLGPLSRQVKGVLVSPDLRAIQGSDNGSQTLPNSRVSWTHSWNMTAG